MVVENTSKISGEQAYESLLESGRNTNMKKYLYAAFILLLGGGVAMYGFFSGNVQFLTAGGIFGAFGLGLIIYNAIIIARLPKDIKKSNKDILEYGVTYTYRFREQSVELTVNVNGKKSKGSSTYYDFRKVYEYEDKFVLKLKDNDVVYVLKEGFQNERMIEFFKKNITLNKKLKIVDKKKNPTKQQ